MVETQTVFSYILPSTGNLVEYRGFTPPAYSLNVFDAIDLAVAMHLGSQASFPTDWSALCINSNADKYFIGGWPGSQADNLNYCNANGDQFYLSNRFLQTGTAQPTNRPLPIKFRCVASNNWFGTVTVAWQINLPTTYSSRLTNIYTATGREYRVREVVHWTQYDGSIIVASGDYTYYYTKSNGNTWVTATTRNSVSGSNTARLYWVRTPVLQRNINGTWTDLTGLLIEGHAGALGGEVSAGTIGPFSSGNGNYYGNDRTYGGSGGGNIPMSIYSQS